jgi:hypothetical protein
VITFVHTIVLTASYWTLSPIGLPSHASRLGPNLRDGTQTAGVD